MTSKELNAKLADLDDHRPDLMPDALKSFQKVIPYYGFGWNQVNFDKLIWVGISPYTIENGQDFVPWVGIMAREKWSHKRWQTTPEQSAKIKELCENLATNPSVLAATELYDYLQSLRA
jgi:hypothetical protein